MAFHGGSLEVVTDIIATEAAERQNAEGIDLNRNFPFAWQPLGHRGDQQYSGPAPLSEPESRAAYALIQRLQPTITIWFHQPLALVDESGGNLAIEQQYASLVGLPIRRLTRYPGSAAGWQNSALPAMGPVLAVIAVVVLVALGYLVGRGPSDARRTFLLIVSGASLFVAAVGVVTALFGVVEVSLPGSVSAGGGRAAVLRSVRVGPGMAERFQAPSGSNGTTMMAPRIAMAVRPRSASSVRSAGLVMILRGVILALVAGAIYRYHWPMTSEPPTEPSPPTRARRQADR